MSVRKSACIRDDAVTASRNLRIAAVACVLVPSAILLLFFMGEVLAGELSGVQHLVQVAPLLILALVGWGRPFIAGVLLLAIGAVMAVGFLFFGPARFPFWVVIMTAGLLYLPPLVGGALFVLASRKT